MPSSKSFFENCASEELIWQSDAPLNKSYKNCSKKNNHDKFFKITQLESNLPSQYRHSKDLVEQIHAMAELTVHIKIYTNPKLPTYGSGFIQRARTQRGTQCPDDDCPDKIARVHHAWGVVTVTTVFHVVKSDVDAKNAQVTINYDSADAVALSGLRLLETEKETHFDWCAVECSTHDMSLLARLNTTIERHERLQMVTYERYRMAKEILTVMVGHPHGGEKVVSFGYSLVKRTVKEVRRTQDWCQYRHTAQSCPGSSGSPVMILGQPLCGYGFWFGHPHNHSGRDTEEDVALTSIGADSISERSATAEEAGAEEMTAEQHVAGSSSRN